jgi:hypothetical protein
MENLLAKKKAHELTTEQVLRRVFHKDVRGILKQLVGPVDVIKKPRKAKKRKSMKGR